MNKEKFMELAMQYSPHAPLEALKRFATALLNEQRERETEPLEKRIDEVLGYWNNSEKQYVDVVAELGMAEQRIAELEAEQFEKPDGWKSLHNMAMAKIKKLETELSHMTMAANSEAQRVNELTAERLAVSPEVGIEKSAACVGLGVPPCECTGWGCLRCCANEEEVRQRQGSFS